MLPWRFFILSSRLSCWVFILLIFIVIRYQFDLCSFLKEMWENHFKKWWLFIRRHMSHNVLMAAYSRRHNTVWGGMSKWSWALLWHFLHTSSYCVIWHHSKEILEWTWCHMYLWLTESSWSTGKTMHAFKRHLSHIFEGAQLLSLTSFLQPFLVPDHYLEISFN